MTLVESSEKMVKEMTALEHKLEHKMENDRPSFLCKGGFRGTGHPASRSTIVEKHYGLDPEVSANMVKNTTSRRVRGSDLKVKCESSHEDLLGHFLEQWCDERKVKLFKTCGHSKCVVKMGAK